MNIITERDTQHANVQTQLKLTVRLNCGYACLVTILLPASPKAQSILSSCMVLSSHRYLL